MTRNKQRGYIFLSSKAWHLRYAVYEGGKRKVRSHKLCAENDTYPSRESVRSMADAFITTIVAANTANGAQAFHSCPIFKHRCSRNIRGTYVKQD